MSSAVQQPVPAPNATGNPPTDALWWEQPGVNTAWSLALYMQKTGHAHPEGRVTRTDVARFLQNEIAPLAPELVGQPAALERFLRAQLDALDVVHVRPEGGDHVDRARAAAEAAGAVMDLTGDDGAAAVAAADDDDGVVFDGVRQPETRCCICLEEDPTCREAKDLAGLPARAAPAGCSSARRAGCNRRVSSLRAPGVT
jgi:hypothetical protein